MGITTSLSADLNLLPVLQALLEERNTSRAALRLNITQPAVSRSLARLRVLFNDPLFTRTPKGLAPTPRAEALALQLQNTLLDIGQMIEPPEFVPAEASHTFRLATTDYGTHLLMPPIIRRLREEAPGVNLEILPWQDDFIDKLDQYSIDIATCTLTNAPAAVHGRGVGTDTFVCVMRESHPLVSAGLDLDSYAGAAHALITMGGEHKGAIDYLLEEQGLQRRVALRIPHFVAALALIASSDLILTIPYAMAAGFARHYRLKLLPLPLEHTPFTYSLIWHERYRKDPGHIWFRQLMYEELSQSIRFFKGSNAF